MKIGTVAVVERPTKHGNPGSILGEEKIIRNFSIHSRKHFLKLLWRSDKKKIWNKTSNLGETGMELETNWQVLRMLNENEMDLILIEYRFWDGTENKPEVVIWWMYILIVIHNIQ